MKTMKTKKYADRKNFSKTAVKKKKINNAASTTRRGGNIL